MAPTYTVKLVRKEEVAVGTMAFSFEKPTNFQFAPGQFIEVTLLDPPETDAEGNSRTFSIASAPFETHLAVATRMRDTAFKRVLKSYAIGTEVGIDGPSGTFTLHDDATRPAVFLMGGIGITPVRSIILQTTRDRLPHGLRLFYSNRRPEEAAFLKDLKELQGANQHYRLIATMTKVEGSGEAWDGETGYVTREMLSKYVNDLGLPIYYISGPSQMVTAMRKTLREAGVAGDQIRVEAFDGY